jgi:hypothetical protein
MSLRYQNGYDWMTAGISSAACIALLESEGWFFHVFGGPNAVSVQPEAPGRFGYGNRLQWSGAIEQSAYKVRAIGSHNSAGGWVSQGMQIGVSSDPAAPTIGVYDGVNDTPLITVAFQANGVIKVYVGTSSTPLGNSEMNAYPNGVGFDVECHFKVAMTTGDVEVRINTISVLHLTNVNTQPGMNAYFDSIYIGAQLGELSFGTSNINHSTDDVRYYDPAGSINNTWNGTSRVQTSLVNGDATPLDFTRSNTGLAHWQNIINQAVDDTLYSFDSTPGDYSLFTLAPLVNSPTVFGVQVTAFVRQDDATQRFYKNRVSSGGVLADGASFATPQTYQAQSDMFELDPNTGFSFTGAAVNALLIGPLDYA